MGSLLGPVLANLFMGYHERNWLQEFDIGEVLFYRRYVDDIFCIFKSEIDAENFKYLNSKYPNVKFTILRSFVKNEVGHLLLHCIGRKCLLVQICDKYCKKQYL